MVMLLVITVFLFAVFSFAAFRFACPHLLPLWSTGRQIDLDFSPTQLSGYDIVVVLGKLVSRSVRHSVSALWLNQRSSAREASDDLPDDLSLTMPLRTTQKDLDAYTLAVRGSPETPPRLTGAQLLLFLSALTEPAMLLSLARSSCKIRPLGAVNVRNRFELLRPDLCTMATLTSFDGAKLTATCLKTTRRVHRGLEIDLVVRLDIPHSAGETTTVFRQIFTILQFEKARTPILPKESSRTPPVDWIDPLPFKIRYKEPTLWARVCKDYNPIHISSFAARILGFPGVIAHGNHVAAKAFDVLQQSPAASDLTDLARDTPLWMEIMFKRPVPVPAQMEVRVSQPVSDGHRSNMVAFQILSRTKICIEGQIGRLINAVAAD